jgi:hypothetical protein
MKKTALIWTAPLWAAALVGGLAACDTNVDILTSDDPTGGQTAVAVIDGETTITATSDGDSSEESSESDVDVSTGTTDVSTSVDAVANMTCHGEDVTVPKVQSVIVLSGECGTVTVTGNYATVSINSAERIVVDADSATVTATKSGPVDVLGAQNIVTVMSMDGTFSDEGNYNTLSSGV